MRKMVEVAETISLEDGRCFVWTRHAVVAAARSLNIYSRGRSYTDQEVSQIYEEVQRLFPKRTKRSKQ